LLFKQGLGAEFSFYPRVLAGVGAVAGGGNDHSKEKADVGVMATARGRMRSGSAAGRRRIEERRKEYKVWGGRTGTVVPGGGQWRGWRESGAGLQYAAGAQHGIGGGGGAWEGAAVIGIGRGGETGTGMDLGGWVGVTAI